MLLHLLYVLGVDIGCNLGSQFHQNGYRVSAHKRNGDPQVRVVFLQLHFLKVFLYSFVDLMRNLNSEWITAFSGRKRKSLKMSMKRLPKGSISTIARTQYQIFKNMVKINHLVHSFYCRLFFNFPDSSSKTILQTSTEYPMTVRRVELKSQNVMFRTYIISNNECCVVQDKAISLECYSYCSDYKFQVLSTMFFATDTAKKEFIKIGEQQFKEKYRIDQFLGKGSFGEVHLAKSKHGNQVALKKFRPEAVQYFYVIIRQISNLKKMDHPNVLKLYDCYIVEQRFYYMVTQYCKHGCLTDYLKNSISEREKIVICQQIAQGLAHAHSLGIVHRDLKPDNIFIGQRNMAKIGDFGCSTRIQNNEVLTSRVGSPAYMDDRVEKNQNYDNTADIYSLGMLYLCIFQGKGIYDDCRSVTDIKRFKSEINKDYQNNIEFHIDGLPDPMKEIVKNCLNPDFSKRHSAEKIAAIIKEKLDQDKGGSRNLISTLDEIEESVENQINSFACNLIAMNKQFQFRHRCEETRQRLFKLLIGNKQVFERTSNIKTLKYVQSGTKAQFTFTVLLFYQYWLQQMELLIRGENSQLASKYRFIDSNTIQKDVLKLALTHIAGEKQKVGALMFCCARMIQGTMNLIGQQKYLPEGFKEFIFTVAAKEPINYGKNTSAILLSNIKKFAQDRLKKEYDFIRGEDEDDARLPIIRKLSDSFL